MKLGFKFSAPVWPWWNGVWGGFALGLYACAWLEKVDWNRAPMLWILPPICIFVSFLPEAFVDITRNVRRFRRAAKR